MSRPSPLLLFLPVATLVVGAVVGGLPYRSQIRALQQQVDAAEACEGGIGAGMAEVFRGQPWQGRGERRVRRFDPPEEVGSDEAPEPSAPAIELPIGDEPADPAERERNLNMARDALDLRYAQAREALVQDARPTEEQLQAFDDEVARMNDALIAMAQDLGQIVRESGGEPSRRDAMLFASESLELLIRTEDRIRSVFDDGQLGRMQDESLDPLSYIDPAVIDVFAELDR